MSTRTTSMLLLLLRLAMRLMRLLLHGCGAFVVVANGSSSSKSVERL